MDTQRNHTEEARHGCPRRSWKAVLVDALCGVLLAALMYRALTMLLASQVVQGEMLRLGLAQAPEAPVSLLVIAAVIAALYALHPLPGSVAALAVLFPPLALYHFGLAIVYAVCAALALPCLYKRGGVFLFALASLAVGWGAATLRPYPSALALLLSCLPVLAGLLYGRWMGWYAAAALAAVTLVAGLAAGQAAIGVVFVGGDEQPLMESEIMMAARDCLFPPDAGDWLAFSGETAGGQPGGFAAALLMWLLGGWGFVWLLAGYGVVAEGLLPRFTPLLLAQVILWAAVGGVTAWAAWALMRKAPAKRLIWVAVIALCGVALTVAGHAALRCAFSAAQTTSAGRVLLHTSASMLSNQAQDKPLSFAPTLSVGAVPVSINATASEAINSSPRSLSADAGLLPGTYAWPEMVKPVLNGAERYT